MEPLPAETTLATLRSEIDAIDREMIALLKNRIQVVKQVAELKHATWPGRCHIRPGRETQMHRAMFEAFQGSDFLPEAAVAIWRHIISASTHLESPLHIATTDALRPLAQSYFGDYVHHISWNNGAMPAEATIAILPFPAAANAALWQDFLKAHPTWRIFASLPVVLHGGLPQALALAPVQAEASGDDVSYFISTTAPEHATTHAQLQRWTLWSIPGFITEFSSAQCVGAHGIPIHSTRETA
jgi:chorismate mutase